ncbi:hypothetical protein EJP02_098 [Escherichia phage EJP2]|nr:hypothetical protein EJP02_098 [Escherichia phage EJP2]
MKVQIMHSVVQDMSVVKFSTLSDYFRCIEFMDTNGILWEPVKYSSRNDTASIRVDEVALNKICKRYGVQKCLN